MTPPELLHSRLSSFWDGANEIAVVIKFLFWSDGTVTWQEVE